MAASNIKVTVDKKNKKLVIGLPLQDPTPSASGKNLTVASTRGNYKSDATINNKQITIGVNCYIPNKD